MEIRRLARPGKERLRTKHQPTWSGFWIWLVFVAVFFLLEGLALGLLLAGQPWALIPVLVVVAHVMHSHLIAFHEAAHRNLSPNRWVNDAAGTLIAVFSLMSLSLFRAIHQTHHAYLTSERDAEMWPFVHPRVPRRLRQLAAAAELALGLAYTPLLFLRAFLVQPSPVAQPALRRRIWAELGLTALVWTGLVTAVVAWQVQGYFLILFVVPGMLVGSMQSLRKYIEHMGLMGTTVLDSTRSVVPQGPMGRLVAITLFNEPFHGVHHQYARLPQEVVPEFTALLEPQRPGDRPPFPSYWAAFKDMAGSLRDPRMGAQWLKANVAESAETREWPERCPAFPRREVTASAGS
jgi:fatty acid desaturase